VPETTRHTFSAGPDAAGQRLDRFLCRRAAISLRAARRLINLDFVRVDNIPRPAAHKLRAGQSVTLLTDTPLDSSDLSVTGHPHVVSATADYAALFKPPGLHTVSLAGATGPSLEAHLPQLFPQRRAILINRLDRDTSGLVLAAFDTDSARRFRELEDQSLVDKRYLALVMGVMPAPMTLKWTLDTADRAKVKTLSTETSDVLRWTLVWPLAYCSNATFVTVRIAKGARHQIRAHLAHAGFPIAGDALYGVDDGKGLKLHHWRVEFPGFCAEVVPGW